MILSLSLATTFRSYSSLPDLNTYCTKNIKTIISKPIFELLSIDSFCVLFDPLVFPWFFESILLNIYYLNRNIKPLALKKKPKISYCVMHGTGHRVDNLYFEWLIRYLKYVLSVLKSGNSIQVLCYVNA